MKIRPILLCAVMVSLCHCGKAIDVGPTLNVERYTVQPDNTVLWETGNFLANGQFRPDSSQILDYSWVNPYDYEAFSGRPLVDVIMYQGCKVRGLLPHWVRSKAEFGISYENFVIIALAGQDPNPTISVQAQPASQNLLSGSYTFFSIEAEPVGYISYQWFHNGKAIPGATDFLYAITDVEAKDAGNYVVHMTTGGRVVSSKIVALRVTTPVSIATEPQSQTVKINHPVAFRVAVKGTGPFTYQWYFDETPIAHATKSFYQIPKVKAQDAGRYGVVVRNALTTDVSTEALLTVNQ